MPLQKMDSFERFEAVSLRTWKSGQKKEITFLNDGRDITTANGPSVIYEVKVGANTTINSFWIRPGGAIHIAVNEFLPLKGKQLMIEKEILKGEDVKTGTRYHAKLLKETKL